ncbi:MAG: helix-turn-helix domain-containing protein [Bacteroidales bacterium]|jgi:hypothetical protein
MKAQLLLPHPQLAPYIKHYYVLDFSSWQQENRALRVPPVGFPVLQFHFGSSTNFYQDIHFTSQSLFIGQCSRHILLYPSRTTKMLSVNFTPYGLYNLLGISPYGFMNSGMESRLFFGQENVNRISQILKNDGIENGINAIETLLLTFQNKKIKTLPYFDRLADKIEAENGLIKCTDFLDNNVSVRSLQRYFHEVIGVPPKLYCQILRHKYIMKLLYNNPEMKWHEMQLSGFYYDFAHFTKDFTRFSGVTPKQYLLLKNSFSTLFFES